MNFKNVIYIVKRKIVNIEDIIIILICSLLLIAIFACFTICYLGLNMEKMAYSYDEAKMLIISKYKSEDDYNLLKNIEHINVIDNYKYAYGVSVLVPELDNALLGEITIRPYLYDRFEITSGRTLEKKNEMICPENFYPHSLYIQEQNDIVEKYYPNNMINSKSLLNKTYDIKVKDAEYNYELVGTYKNMYGVDVDTCFVLKETFDEIKDNIDYCTLDDNSGEEVCYEYNNLMVLVDDYKNMNYVSEKLNEYGYSSSETFIFDDELLLTITYTPIFIALIIIIITITIIYNYYSKKSVIETYNYALLKSIGYNNSQISKVYVYKSLFSIVISLVLSIISYIVIYNYISNKYLPDLLYGNWMPPIPYLFIIFYIFMYALFICYITNRFVKKRLLTSVNVLFRESEPK